MQNLITGLQILERYGDWNVSTEYDIIYAGADAEKISKEDCEKLEALAGWHIDSEFNCWAYFT